MQTKEGGGMRWGLGRVLVVFVLYALSISCVVLGIKPLFDMDFDAKNLANLLFVASHAFYMFSFLAVRRKSHFVFWATSFLLLSGTTLLFYFYEDLFL